MGRPWRTRAAMARREWGGTPDEDDSCSHRFNWGPASPERSDEDDGRGHRPQQGPEGPESFDQGDGRNRRLNMEPSGPESYRPGPHADSQTNPSSCILAGGPPRIKAVWGVTEKNRSRPALPSIECR